METTRFKTSYETALTLGLSFRHEQEEFQKWHEVSEHETIEYFSRKSYVNFVLCRGKVFFYVEFADGEVTEMREAMLPSALTLRLINLEEKGTALSFVEQF